MKQVMKFVASFLLILSLVLFIAACGKDDKDQSNDGTLTSTADTTVEVATTTGSDEVETYETGDNNPIELPIVP